MIGRIIKGIREFFSDLSRVMRTYGRGSRIFITVVSMLIAVFLVIAIFTAGSWAVRSIWNAGARFIEDTRNNLPVFNSDEDGTSEKETDETAESEETEMPGTTEEAKTTGESTQPVEEDSGFIFADSDSKYLSQSEIEALTDQELRIALNELYARRGRIFEKDEWTDYFSSQSWYEPSISKEDFNEERIFNSIEKSNRDILIEEQEKRGLR